MRERPEGPGTGEECRRIGRTLGLRLDRSPDRGKAPAVLCLLLLVSGCATIPNGAELAATTSSFAYSTGRGTQSFASTPSMVISALNSAMTDLDMSEVRVIREIGISRVQARTSDRRSISATVRFFQGATTVAVRIGWFGDEPLSRALLDRVGVRLGTKEPEAIPEVAPSEPSGNPFFSRRAVSDEEMLRDFVEAPYRDRVVP
ncbi:DUF3568 family protein [Aquisphaera insulae]|uniref:DUF3568 family protein n=1 Tax=Aquisphaera insulae TaxID=2712864 RepID=UPI0013EE30FF|nr:DUF3568 family protein [Aquisphaera insulae]